MQVGAPLKPFCLRVHFAAGQPWALQWAGGALACSRMLMLWLWMHAFVRPGYGQRISAAAAPHAVDSADRDLIDSRGMVVPVTVSPHSVHGKRMQSALLVSVASGDAVSVAPVSCVLLGRWVP